MKIEETRNKCCSPTSTLRITWFGYFCHKNNSFSLNQFKRIITLTQNSFPACILIVPAMENISSI